MHLKNIISNYTRFNNWANHKIVSWLREIDINLLYQQTPSSFSSIDYTLQHILRTQKFWLKFINQEDTSLFDWRVRENEVENIMAELLEVSAQMEVLFGAFTEEDLQQKLHLDTPCAKNELCRYEYILHIINHSTFHRGQIITMARCINITENVPNTDYNMFHL